MCDMDEESLWIMEELMKDGFQPSHKTSTNTRDLAIVITLQWNFK